MTKKKGTPSTLAEKRKRHKTLIGTNHTQSMTWDKEVPLLACKEKEKRWKPNTLIDYLTEKDFNLGSRVAEIHLSTSHHFYVFQKTDIQCIKIKASFIS